MHSERMLSPHALSGSSGLQLFEHERHLAVRIMLWSVGRKCLFWVLCVCVVSRAESLIDRNNYKQSFASLTLMCKALRTH